MKKAVWLDWWKIPLYLVVLIGLFKISQDLIPDKKATITAEPGVGIPGMIPFGTSFQEAKTLLGPPVIHYSDEGSQYVFGSGYAIMTFPHPGKRLAGLVFDFNLISDYLNTDLTVDLLYSGKHYLLTRRDTVQTVLSKFNCAETQDGLKKVNGSGALDAPCDLKTHDSAALHSSVSDLHVYGFTLIFNDNVLARIEIDEIKTQ